MLILVCVFFDMNGSNCNTIVDRGFALCLIIIGEVVELLSEASSFERIEIFSRWIEDDKGSVPSGRCHLTVIRDSSVLVTCIVHVQPSATLQSQERRLTYHHVRL